MHVSYPGESPQPHSCARAECRRFSVGFLVEAWQGLASEDRANSLCAMDPTCRRAHVHRTYTNVRIAIRGPASPHCQASGCRMRDRLCSKALSQQRG